MWRCGDSATLFGDVVVVPEGNCGVEIFAVLRTGVRYDTSPQKGSCTATKVAIWQPLKTGELRDSGSYIATSVGIR